MSKECDFFERFKIIYTEDFNRYKKWYEYDSNGNLIHYKDSNEFELYNELV